MGWRRHERWWRSCLQIEKKLVVGFGLYQMIAKKDIKSLVMVIIALLAASLVFEFIASKLIYNPQEVEQCKAFVMNDTDIQDFFGTIKNVKLRVQGGGRSVSTKEGISGSCSFRVSGIKQKGAIKVKWKKDDDKITVTQISMREGFTGTRILWPKSEATSVNYILPSHIWDGIILLVGASLVFFFYRNSKKNGKMVKLFFPFVNWSERSRAIMELLFIVASLGSIILSILCFLNIYTLF